MENASVNGMFNVKMRRINRPETPLESRSMALIMAPTYMTNVKTSKVITSVVRKSWNRYLLMIRKNVLRKSYVFLKFFAAATVLNKSMVMVMGPTPPGTGVIQPATFFTPSKSTSPHSLPSSLR